MKSKWITLFLAIVIDLKLMKWEVYPITLNLISEETQANIGDSLKKLELIVIFKLTNQFASKARKLRQFTYQQRKCACLWIVQNKIRTKIRTVISREPTSKFGQAQNVYDKSSQNISEDTSSVSNENSNKSQSKFILPTLEENIDIRKQKIISPLKKVKSNQISARYLKDHVKFKNTAEFFLNVMHERVSQLESNENFHKIKSKKLLRKLNKKAIKIATSRLKVKNLMEEKPSFAVTKIKFKDLPFNDKSFGKTFINENTRRLSKASVKNSNKNEVTTAESNKSNTHISKTKRTTKNKKNDKPTDNSNFMFQTADFFKTYSIKDSKLMAKEGFSNKISRIY